jgi:hypothetical protein
VLAIISLIFFCVALFSPSFVQHFPRIHGEYLNYHDAFVHVYLVSRAEGAEGLVLQRNSGIAWEPGAYQALLSLALLLTVLRLPRDRRVTTSEVLRMSILALTVISTTSFAGFASLALIALFAGHRLSSATLRISLLVASALLLATSWTQGSLWLEIHESTTSRLSAYTADTGPGILARLSLDQWDAIGLTPWFILGSSFSTLEATGDPVHNSVLKSLIALGIPFTLILLWMYWQFAKKLGSHGFLVISLLLLWFMTENLFRSPLFLFLAFAGLVHASSFSVLRKSDPQNNDERAKAEHSEPRLGARGRFE